MQSRASSQNREALEVAGRLAAQHLHLDLHIVAILVGKQRSNGAVNQAADQHFVIGDAAFALAECAGDPASAGELLPILDRQREKALTGFWFGRGDYGGQHDVVAAAR